MPDSYKRIDEYAELPQATDDTLLLSSLNSTTYSVTAETLSEYVHTNDTHISDLPVATEIHNSDKFVVAQSGVEKQAAGQLILDYVDDEVEAQVQPVVQDMVDAAIDSAMTTTITPAVEAAEAAQEAAEEAAEAVEEGLYSKADAIIAEASGAVASFLDGSDAPVKSVTVQIEPVQSGTGDPSPDNVRPITGWTGATIKRTGRNLLDAQEIVTKSGHATHVFVEDGYLHFKTGNSTQNGIQWTGLNLHCPLTYKLSIKNFASSNNVVRLTAYFTDGTNTNLCNSTLTAGQEVTVSGTIGTTGKTVSIIRSQWTNNAEAGINLSVSQIEFGTTAHPYEPFSGQTVPVSFESAGTVYGGNVTINGDGSGVLSVDSAKYVCTGTETLGSSGSGATKYYIITLRDTAGLFARTSEALCSHYTVQNISSSTTTVGFAVVNSSSQNKSNLGIRPNDVANTTVASYKAWLAEQYAAGTPVEVFYYLATPQTHTLTADQVRTLLGYNNLWADTGDISVEYRADTKLYIDNGHWIPPALSPIIAPTETSFTATRNYTAKELVIVNNQLYKVTANIANGGTIAVGTNVVATTLSDIIKTLI